MAGTLVICATPIGNLGDLSPRMVEALSDADVVLAEDTRRTRKLLTHAGIRAKLVSYHRGNQKARDAETIERLRAGERVTLVTDAGMPAISDPGEELVRACVAAEIAVECVPGPSAALAALVLSGLPTGRFVFEGFLPRPKGQRRKRLQELAGEQRTIVLFEAAQRLVALLEDAAENLGPGRPVAICRELTKLHEQVWRGNLAEAVRRWGGVDVRGEVAVVIGGAEGGELSPEEAEARARELIAEALGAGASTRDAADAAKLETGLPKSKLYALALELARPHGTGQR